MQASDLPSLLPEPDPWRREAACRGQDPNLFVGPDYAGHAAASLRKPRTLVEWRMSFAGALVFCDICPVTDECLDYALSIGELAGVYGGLTPGERRRLTDRKTRICRRCGGVFEPKPHQTLCSDACRARPAPKEAS